MPPSSRELAITVAVNGDAAAIASLRNAAAEHLTRRFGRGHWSGRVTEKGTLRDITSSRVLIARTPDGIVGTLQLTTTKPWAIDVTYFATVHRPLYLLSMAVDPRWQGQGIGRRLVEEARVVSTDWPADALRLDAYNAAAGAGGFYEKCGFREVGRVIYRGVPLVYFELLLQSPLKSPNGASPPDRCVPLDGRDPRPRAPRRT